MCTGLSNGSCSDRIIKVRYFNPGILYWIVESILLSVKFDIRSVTNRAGVKLGLFFCVFKYREVILNKVLIFETEFCIMKPT